MARMSSASRVGETWPPILVPARPRMTASWIRRLPWTTTSFTTMGRWPDSGWAWARAVVGVSRKAKKMERRTLPTGVMRASGPSCPDPACCGSVLGQRQGRLGDLRFSEDEIIPLHIELESRPIRDLAADDGFGERILYVLLDRAPQLAGAVGGIVALLDQEVQCHRRGLDADPLVAELGVDPVEHEPDDPRDVLAGEA